MSTPLSRVITNEIFRVPARRKRKPAVNPSDISGHRPQRYQLRIHRGCSQYSAQHLERRYSATPVALSHRDSGRTGQPTMDGQQHQTEHR